MRILQHCLTHRKIDAFRYDLVQTKNNLSFFYVSRKSDSSGVKQCQKFVCKTVENACAKFSSQTLTKATIKKQDLEREDTICNVL